METNNIGYKKCKKLRKNGHRNLKFLNNIVESDHRRIKKITKQMLGFKLFQSASILIDGIEISAMIKKGQVNNISNISDEVDLIHNQLFSINV